MARRRIDGVVRGTTVSRVCRSGVVCTQCSGALLKSLGRFGIGTIPGCREELIPCPTKASVAMVNDGKDFMVVCLWVDLGEQEIFLQKLCCDQKEG